jgi:hypothetical protein
MRLLGLLAVLLSLMGSPVHAQLHRCTDTAGRVTYTDTPCPSTANQRRVSIVDNKLDSRADRREAARQRAVERRLAAETDAASPGGPVGIGPSERELRCASAKRDYESVAFSNRSRLDALRSAEQSVRRACGAVQRDPRHRALELQAAERAATQRQHAGVETEGATQHGEDDRERVISCTGSGCLTSRGFMLGNPRVELRGNGGVRCVPAGGGMLRCE